jgi:hypothetical protein
LISTVVDYGRIQFLYDVDVKISMDFLRRHQVRA